LAQEKGRVAFLVDGPQDLQEDDFNPNDVVLITAGASAPEEVVASTIQWLKDRFGASVEEKEVRKEEVYFPLPKALRQLVANTSPPS
jgi:4-hydroxy-3-methylbut-2-enyl diphosphate reductase